MSANDHHDRDNDPVWDLLDQAPTPKAGPLFARNVMREIRIGEDSPAPWWRRLLAPVPLTAGAVAAAAAFAIIVAIDRPDTPVADNPETPGIDTVEVYDVERNLLIAAAEEPSLVSDEELLALLY
jgi:hypothetical protein